MQSLKVQGYGFYVQVPGHGTASQYLINSAIQKIRELEDEQVIAYRGKGYTQQKICEVTRLSERRFRQVLAEAKEGGTLNVKYQS
ncbi:MAG: hypothetical protein AB7E31_16460 [Desulfitobacterium sp.]